MARPRGPRLSMVSLDGEDPQISLDEADWAAFEKTLGKAFNDVVRAEVSEICNWHLGRQWVENRAEPQSWVIDRAVDGLAKVEKAFQFLAEDLGHHEGDAHGEFSWQVDEFLSRQTFRLNEPALLKFRLREDGEGEIVPVEDWNQFVVRPSSMLALSVVSSLMSALMLIKRGDGLHSSGYEQGSAYKSFLLRMREWAKAHDWPYGAYSGAGEGGQPSQLSTLIYEITQRFPEELRTEVKNASAVAKRLKRALKDKQDAEKQAEE